MTENSAALFAISIFADGADEPCRIGRTAGAGIPTGSGGEHMTVARRFSRNALIDFQGIYIEKPLSVKLHSRKDGVVKSKLHNIAIFAVYVVFKHLFRKEYKPHGCAGLGVCSVGRKVIVNGESLALNGGADTAGYVHFSADDVFPQAAAGGKKLLVVGLGGKVCHSCVEVHRTDGMACGFGLFTDRLCALAVIIVPWVAVPHRPAALFGFPCPEIGSLSTLVYEMLRQPQKMPVSGKAVQPQECKLYLRVSRDTLILLNDKTVVYTFRIFYRNIQQTALARCFIVGTGGFDKVPRAVQLMTLKQICPALFRVLYGKVRVQIAVLVLGIGDDADKLISLMFKLLIGLVGNGISRSFKPLVGVAPLRAFAALIKFAATWLFSTPSSLAHNTLC